MLLPSSIGLVCFFPLRPHAYCAECIVDGAFKLAMCALALLSVNLKATIEAVTLLGVMPFFRD